MKNLQRVVWAKGMLLTPQHFQSHCDYFEDSLQFRFLASSFENWGVTKIAFDEDAIANGTFAVKSLSGILHDGTLIDCPGSDLAPASSEFTSQFSAKQDILDVYVGLPRKVEGQNVHIGTNEHSPLDTRYKAMAREIPDENGVDQSKTVQFARRNLRILYGSSRDGCSAIRVAQIVRAKTGEAKGKYQLSGEFVPPLLNIAASNSLMALLKQQSEMLATKSESLAATRRERGKSLADFNVSETGSFWLLHTVNSFLPELLHILNVRRGHPEQVFLAMLRLAGALSAFSLDKSKDPRKLPEYDHENLYSCFSAINVVIRDLLDTVIPPNFLSVPLVEQQRIWTGRIEEEGLVHGAQTYLALSSGGRVDDLIRDIVPLVKVADQGKINSLIKFSLPSLKLRHVPSPPTSLPLRLDSEYFSVNQSGELWDGIVSTRTIAIYIPEKFAAVRPEVLILKSR
jgi:type VI secretion system protein ImpJ